MIPWTPATAHLIRTLRWEVTGSCVGILQLVCRHKCRVDSCFIYILLCFRQSTYKLPLNMSVASKTLSYVQIRGVTSTHARHVRTFARSLPLPFSSFIPIFLSSFFHLNAPLPPALPSLARSPHHLPFPPAGSTSAHRYGKEGCCC